MVRFDHWRRRLLQFAVLVLLPFSLPLSSGSEQLSLLAAACCFLVTAVSGEVRFTRHAPAVRRLSLWFELCLAGFAAAALSAPFLLFFMPLQAGSLVMLYPLEKPWRKRLFLSFVLLPALCAAFFAARTWLPFFAFAAAVSAGSAYSVLQLIQEHERQRREIEQSLKTKEAILSTLAHEIRTPLTVIQSTVDIMTEGRVGPLQERQQQFLVSVGSNVRRLVNLSETILASIKVESAWFSVKRVPVDIRRVIKSVAQHMRPFLEEKGLELRYSFPKLLSRPLADEGWIHQVLVNLVHNAVKHLRGGGTVIVSVNENEQAVVISVSDNGSGIHMSERMQVFNEFFQGDTYSDAQLNGAGLGLAIVKRVIEKHRGKVYVGSVEGVGTTVSFTLPLKADGTGDE